MQKKGRDSGQDNVCIGVKGREMKSIGWGLALGFALWLLKVIFVDSGLGKFALDIIAIPFGPDLDMGTRIAVILVGALVIVVINWIFNLFR